MASETNSTIEASGGAAAQTGRGTGAPRADLDTPPSRLYERALTLLAMGFYREATLVLRQVTEQAPDHAPAWERLAKLLRLAGKDQEAEDANSRAAAASAMWPAARDDRSTEEFSAAERALLARVKSLATPVEQLKELREHLRVHETDAPAMRLLGRVEMQDGYRVTARDLFERAIELAPHYDNARADLALLLLEMDENKRAVRESRLLVERAPDNADYRAIHANALCAVSDFGAAIPLIEEVVRAKPDNARSRRVYARSLYIAGRRDESAREYRACLAIDPRMAEAYAGLSDLRGRYLNENDVGPLRELLRDDTLYLEDRRTLLYALGHVLEQARDFAGSFAAYEAGVSVSQTVAANCQRAYSPARMEDELKRRRAVFTNSFLARTEPADRPPHCPIFVLGMPRAGSTLVEQILASHSLVEGTKELPVLGNIVWNLSQRRLIKTPDAYPECLTELGESELAELGARYLSECEVYRRTDRPFFIDKQPWNWRDVGLIRLILPHAKIIDVRREPMAACFAMFKLQLDIDALFPYGLRHLAHYYTHYARTMAHYDAVMPGRVHFLSYERLVENTESEIRKLLDYCGLPFEESCLRFWETGRAVATPSGEQVRQPIYRHAVEQWRNFEPWLGPLKAALAQAAGLAEARSKP
ncbi:MAG TPA: sulfotransferase [Rhizomicrobium sp.]|nr:sulfotransferase [Rhizomicrobium sp.]